jgi:dTDP-4-dehydrorhamnose reductase
LIKQHEKATDSLAAIDLNARFPHQLALLCQTAGSRLIHISTDVYFLVRRVHIRRMIRPMRKTFMERRNP